MKIRPLLSIVAACFCAAALNAQQQWNNAYGQGQAYASTPGGVYTIGWAPPGYTGGAAQTAGCIGEVISSVVPSGSAVSLTTATGANVTSVSLTAGDWEVDCICYVQGTGTTSYTILQAGLNTTSATLPALTSTTPIAYVSIAEPATVPAQSAIPQSLSPTTIQINVSTTTTVYLVTNCTFSASTASAYGWVRARRIR